MEEDEKPWGRPPPGALVAPADINGCRQTFQFCLLRWCQAAVICPEVKNLVLSAAGGPGVNPFTSGHKMKTYGFSNWQQNRSVPLQHQSLFNLSLEAHSVVQYSWNINPRSLILLLFLLISCPLWIFPKEQSKSYGDQRDGVRVLITSQTSLYPQRRHLGPVTSVISTVSKDSCFTTWR